MTDEEEDLEFSHPIGDLIMDELIEGEACAYAIDDEGSVSILELAVAALETPEADKMTESFFEAAAILEAEDGAEGVATLMTIASSLGLEPPKKKVEYEPIEDDDGVEQTFGRRAASILGKKKAALAPKIDAAKPDGAMSLQALIGTKRRM